MTGWVVAAVVALWLVRVAVEARRWYWQRELERLSPPIAAPRSHVRRVPGRPFDQDSV